MKKFSLPKSTYEVVCATGKIKSFSRKIAVFAVYIPPKYTPAQVEGLTDYLADAIEKVKREVGDPYICIGGDINNKDITAALTDFPEIKILPNIPTRFGAALDLCFTNFNDEIFELGSHRALTSAVGTPSDHLVVSYNFKVKRRHVFGFIERKVRPIRPEGINTFQSRLLLVDWSLLDGMNATDMVTGFQ